MKTTFKKISVIHPQAIMFGKMEKLYGSVGDATHICFWKRRVVINCVSFFLIT